MSGFAYLHYTSLERKPAMQLHSYEFQGSLPQENLVSDVEIHQKNDWISLLRDDKRFGIKIGETGRQDNSALVK